MSRAPSLAPASSADLARARRSAFLAGGTIAVLVALLAMIGSALLIGLSLLTIAVGVVLCVTVVGVIVGLPLILLGVLGLIGGIVGGSGGVFFALLLGAGCGFGYYRVRLRRRNRAAHGA